MILTRDDAFRAVCEILTPDPTTGKSNIGTGMFVSSPAGGENAFGWIVTASHVARKTNNQTKLIVANAEGKAEELPLILFGSMSNWRHHTRADISAFRVVFSKINAQFMSNRFFPFDHFHLDKTPVSRDYELTAIGFPNGLGTSGYFSPLTFRSFASSAFLTLLRADTHQPSTFFCLENPSVGGYSGCPVFDLGYSTNGVITTRKENCKFRGGRAICTEF